MKSGIVYLDCAMGISGDMFLGAMVDLGVGLGVIESALEALPLEPGEVEVRTTRETRQSIGATAFRVRVREDPSPRDYGAIREMIRGSRLSRGVRDLALSIFGLIAHAEGRIHGVPAEEVHFHEIGAMDSIADIVGAAAAVEHLGFPAFYSSAVALGRGTARTMHGTIPIPAPATLEILRGVPVRPGPAPFELTTPTGAAIVKTLAEGFGPMPEMVVEAMGYGAGKKDFEGAANLLRAVRGRPPRGEEARRGEVIVLETNLDDMTPQIGGYLLERLLEKGALEAYFTEAIMKKSRPGFVLTVLAAPERRDALMETIFRESTTIGVRIRRVERECLERCSRPVQTPWGPVSVKFSSFRGEVVNVEPEYEEARRVALEKGVPLKLVMQEARAAALSQGEEN